MFRTPYYNPEGHLCFRLGACSVLPGEMRLTLMSTAIATVLCMQTHANATVSITFRVNPFDSGESNHEACLTKKRRETLDVTFVVSPLSSKPPLHQTKVQISHIYRVTNSRWTAASAHQPASSLAKLWINLPHAKQQESPATISSEISPRIETILQG